MICVGVLIDAETVGGIRTCFCTFVATISREEEKGGCATLMPLYHAPHAPNEIQRRAAGINRVYFSTRYFELIDV
jgi:hypothetical protein